MLIFFCILLFPLANTTNGVMNMHWYHYLLIILMLLLILFIFSNIKVKINFKKDNKNDLITIDIWMFYQLIHYRREVPLIVFESFNEGIKYKTNDNIQISKENEAKDRITTTKISRFQKQFNHFLRNIQDFFELIKYFLSHVHFDRFFWKSTIGVGDAMLTGITIGAIWGLKGSAIGIISKFMKLRKQPEIYVEAVYQEMVLQSQFECILRFRVGYVFLTGIRLAMKIIKGGVKKWQENSNIPFKV